jgi:hypothetical protein
VVILLVDSEERVQIFASDLSEPAILSHELAFTKIEQDYQQNA